VHLWDVRVLATFAFAIFGLVMYLRSTYTTQVDFDSLVLPSLLQGLGMAAFFVPLTVLSLSGLDPSRVAAATGLSNFVRLLFGAFGASVTTTLWENRTHLHHAQLTESSGALNPAFNQSMQQLQQLGLSQEQAVHNVARIVEGQASMLGINDIFWASSILFLVLGAFVWLAKPIHGAPDTAGAAGGH